MGISRAPEGPFPGDERDAGGGQSKQPSNSHTVPSGPTETIGPIKGRLKFSKQSVASLGTGASSAGNWGGAGGRKPSTDTDNIGTK